LISSCIMPKGLGLFQRRSRSCLHWLFDIVRLTALSMSHFSQPEVANSSFSDH
jgi:hypothetical protein